MGALNKVRREILAQRLAASLRQDPKTTLSPKELLRRFGVET